MTTGELLKIMSETVAEYQTCVLEVIMGTDTAVAHLIPLEQWREEIEGEDYGEDEED